MLRLSFKNNHLFGTHFYKMKKGMYHTIYCIKYNSKLKNIY